MDVHCVHAIIRLQKEMFQIREKRSFRVPCITITSSSVVKYEQFTLTVVEQSGSEARNLYRFENIEVFQVYNRIEGFLTFHESTAPAGRTFRGYGKFMHAEDTEIVLAGTIPVESL